MRVYHGEQDTLVPVSHGRHTAEMIEGSTLVLLPEHGHISMITEIPRISTDLADQQGPERIESSGHRVIRIEYPSSGDQPILQSLNN